MVRDKIIRTFKMETINEWLDNQDIMLKLHISNRTLQRLRKNGFISYSKIGKKIYYRSSDVEQMLTEHSRRNNIKQKPAR